MKFLVVSDSFKGTLTSTQIGRIVKEELSLKNIQCDYIPMSDGGEGFIDCISYIEKITPFEIDVVDALGEHNIAKYIYKMNTEELFLELAEAVGINRISKDKLDIMKASTFGLGKMIKETIARHNPKIVYIGLGGSASIDLGAGLLEGLGVVFKDKNNKSLTFIGNEKIGEITKIDISSLEKYKNISFIAVNDVTIKLFNKDGAIQKYSIQKGATKEMIPKIAKNSRNFVKVTNLFFGSKVLDFAGAGVAGGTAFALHRYLNARLINGIDFILDKINFLSLCADYDGVITGEGKLDFQTLQGKVVLGVLKRFPQALILCGSTEGNLSFDNVYPIVPNICKMEESLVNSEDCLKRLINSIKWGKWIK